MRQWISLGLFALLTVAGLAYAGESGETYHWKPAEMSTRPAGRAGQLMRKVADVRLLPDDVAMPKEIDCHDDPCKFDLYYFFGKGFNLARPERKNILFIAGGPGALVDNVNQINRPLGHLEASHNIVYFDLRGGGRSVIPASNKFDRFLRGQYVADDIERIRKAVLNGKPWDAIYSHSWGSVPAQLYVAKFGPKKVKTLILSAPVVRDRDTHAARARMTAENLQRIYTIYRSSAGQTCRCQDGKLPVMVNRFLGEPTQKVSDLNNVEAHSSYNFCFLDVDEGREISRKLEKLLGDIEEQFGSVDFVTDHYAALQKGSDAKSRPRFPLEFYTAIKQLQFTGAPEVDYLPYSNEFAVQINAALVIGHYLTLDMRSGNDSLPVARQCALDSPFLNNSRCAAGFCKIIAPPKPAGRGGGQLESIRANQVLGLYDGVARSLLRSGMIERDNKDCFTGKDVAAFANGSGGGKDHARAAARRLGIDPAEKVCPWTPRAYTHKVRTLILKGARDSVIAGCQAEDFYRDGLEGERLLLEFRGTGHSMYIATLTIAADRTAYSKSFRRVLEKFMDLPVAQFRSDQQVAASLDKLQAGFREPDSGRAGCPV